MPPSTRIKKKASGFALLITITLLAFLVLLLVSLSGFTRVETQVTANSQKLGQARENALMALNIALGQLQQYAGPDQRATAVADIAGNSATGAQLADNAAPTNTTNLDGTANGLTAVQQGSRQWTGVWRNTATADYTQKPDAIPSSSPSLLNWLVSGNELTASTVTPATTISGITSGMSPLTKVSVNGKADSGVLLVGKGTVGTSANPENSADTDVEQYVVAPLVDISAPAGTIPGLGASATVGRYAWWVGDEGVKARVNLRSSYMQVSSAADVLRDKQYSFYTSQRSGIELLSYDGTNMIDTAYPFDQSSLSNVLSLNSFPFAGPTAANQTNLFTASRALFHDLTAVSQSVLADSYAGGLKKNLTAVLENAAGPADTDPIFTPENSTDYGVPNWGMLRSWRLNSPSSATTAAPWVLPNATTTTRSPVITYANIMVGISLGAKTTDGSGNVTYPVYLRLMPVVILWNPYTAPLAATNAEIAVQFTGNCTLQAKINNVATGPALYLNNALSSTSGTSAFVFKLNCPQLAQGESVVFENTAGGTKSITTIDGTSYEAYSLGGNTLSAITNNAPTYASLPLLLPTGINVNESDIYTDPASGTENTATKFDITAAFSATGTNFTAGCNPNQIRVYLAQQGAWAAGLSRDKVYHAVEDVGIAPVTSLIAQTDFAGSNRNPLLYLDDSVDEAFTFKMQATFEGVDDCTLRSDLGYQFLSRGAIDGNVTAWDSSRTLQDENNPNGSSYFGGISFPYSVIKTKIAGGITQGPGLVLSYTTARNQGAGRAFRTGGYSQMLDMPKGDVPLLSIGQLQNAPLSLLAAYPMYAIGNAVAPIRIPANTQYQVNAVHQAPATSGTYTYTDTYYDLSWHLNRALWDKYFMLGVEGNMTQQDLNNRVPLPVANYNYTIDQSAPDMANLRGATSYSEAAAHVMVDGGFNINSTSVAAWAALLTGSYNVDANLPSPDYTTLYAPMSRFSVAPSVTVGSPAGRVSAWDYYPSAGPGDAFYEVNQGQRELLLRDKPVVALSAAGRQSQLRATAIALAQLIVQEIRKRGPFVSVADFVNRQITNNTTTALRGVLQAAIDNPGGATNSTLLTQNPSPVNILRASDQMKANDGYFPTIAYQTNSFLGGTTEGAFTYTSHATFNNYQLTQADMLTAIGPRLASRSDTFRIRTYGEYTNPVTGEITRAWCEAIVQRTPNFVDPTDDATKALSAVDSTNQRFGRKFEIVSFRWLNSNDI